MPPQESPMLQSASTLLESPSPVRNFSSGLGKLEAERDEIASTSKSSHENIKSIRTPRVESRIPPNLNAIDTIAGLLPEIEIKDGVLDLSRFLERGEMIDQGAFGEVYKGEWKNLPTSCDNIEMPRVAIKVMRTCRLIDEKQRQKRMKNLRRELYVLQNLVHDHILPLLGTANLNGDENFPVIVSPWMENGTITDYIVKHPDLPKLPFLLDIINALLYLHRFNPSVVHGDMKAANVLVNQYGQLFLCDFGLSRMTEDTTLWITTTTHAGYTTRWAPPELLHPDGECKATMASDVYSYAMTCFEILSGQVPFASMRTEGAVVMAVAMMDKRPERELVSDISDGLWDLMTRCWAKNPGDRPSTMDVAEEMQLLSNLNSGDEQRDHQAGATSTPDSPASLSVEQEHTDNPHEPSLSPWQRIHQRFLQWAVTLPISEIENGLKSTLPNNKVDEVALQIWLYQVYKRYAHTRMTERPQQNVDCLFVPSTTVNAINNAILDGRHDDARMLFEDLWNSFGFEQPPRLLLSLERDSEDPDHWVVHSYSLWDSHCTTYDSSAKGHLLDLRDTSLQFTRQTTSLLRSSSPFSQPFDWWYAICLTWPNQILNPNQLTRNFVASHRAPQSLVDTIAASGITKHFPAEILERLMVPADIVLPLYPLVDNTVATAGIFENVLNGLPPESFINIGRLRGLMSEDITSLMNSFSTPPPETIEIKDASDPEVKDAPDWERDAAHSEEVVLVKHRARKNRKIPNRMGRRLRRRDASEIVDS